MVSGGSRWIRQPAASFAKLPNKAGTYLVTTSSGTRYVFDRADFTVTRIPAPGAGAGSGVNDGLRVVRTIESCEVGEPGFWTLRSADPGVDWHWQATTPIVSIIEITTEQAAEMYG